MKEQNEQWVVNAFDRALASIGGYNFLITSMILFAIGGYQSFKMDSSFSKTLYTHQETPSPAPRSEEDLLDL